MNSRGFGIIEVLISAMILMVVVGAAVGLSRSMVKKNVEVGEKVQAYNLVREGLEIGRAYRDTIWIDYSSESWGDYFPDFEQDFIFVSDPDTGSDGAFDIQLTNDGERITKDGIEYTRTYIVKGLTNSTLENLNSIVDPDSQENFDLSSQIMTLSVKVSWNDGKNDVQAATILTNWKPQI